jgi:uncharacterized protein (TIGR02118 family)
LINVSVMWPNGDAVTFDHDYYLQTHIPMLVDVLGDKLKKVEVNRGMGGREPGSPPPYLAITHLHSTRSVTFRRPFARTPSGSAGTSLTSPISRSRCRFLRS